MRFPLLVIATTLLAGCQQHQASTDIPANGASLQAARDALSEGEAGTSLAIAKGILASQPTNTAALVQAGDAQAALGDRLDSEITYKRALAISPHDVHARLGLGKLQVRDSLPAAEATFRSVVADAPRDPLALNDLGYVLDLQERHKEAQAEYQTAMQADPDRLATRVNLAVSLALSGNAALAEQMLRDLAASSSATARVRADYALAQVMAGHDREASATLGRELSPAEAQTAVEGFAALRPVLASK